MRKEIAVICSHHSIDKDTGYGMALKLYDVLSKKYKINIIVPRGLDIFTDEKIALNPNMTMQMIAVDQPSPHCGAASDWVYYTEISKNESLIRKLKNAAKQSDLIVCDSIYCVSLTRRAFPDRFIIYRSLEAAFKMVPYANQYFPDWGWDETMKTALVEFERKACEDADLILTHTQEDADDMCKFYGIAAEKIKILPVCFQEASILKDYLPVKRISHCGLKCLLLSATTMENPSVFMKAAKNLPDVEFHIVGIVGLDLCDGPSNIIVHGIVTDEEKYQIARKCHFAMNINHMTHGQNAKVVDYMRLGLPVLANRLGVRGYNVREYIEYYPAEYETLERDIRQFCELSDDERYEIAQNAFRHVCREFNFEKYLGYFEKLLDNHVEEYEYYIFGAGGAGKRALGELKMHRYQCVGFIDNNAARHGLEFCGKKIFAPEVAFADIRASKNKKVVIAVSTTYWREVANQICNEVGFENMMIYGDKASCLLNMDWIDSNKFLR